MHVEGDDEHLDEMSGDNNNESLLPKGVDAKLLTDNKFQKTEDGYIEASTTRALFAQCMVTGAVMIIAAACGMPIGYSAILLPQLNQVNGSMQADEDMGSWIASVHSAATPIGSFLSGMLMERFGRKLALQISSVPLIVGWILIALAQNHATLLLGRVTAGMSVGLTAAPGQVLIGEISEARVRGVFSSVPFASYSFGILLVYALGYFLNWRIVAGLGTVLPVIAILVIFLLPESPVWLIRKGNAEAARKSLIWLRGGDKEKANQEFLQLVKRLQQENSTNESSYTIKTMFKKPQVLKPFIIVNIFNILQVFSGTYVIVFYAVDIFTNIGGEDFDTFLAAVITAGVRFIFTIVSAVLLGVISRRAIALSSGIGTAISALCLGTFLYLEQSYCTSNGYFAAICVLVYIAANTVGFMILPGVMIGELYPAKIRGFAGGLTFMTFNFMLFVVTKLFPVIKNIIGMHGVFWVFGGTSVIASVFLYLTLPETKGRTLNQIEDYFLQKNVFWVSRKKVKEASISSSKS